jgi:hypothetical protein
MLGVLQATVGYADSLSQPLSLRFASCPAAPLFIEVESDDTHGLFVISTIDVSRQPHGQGQTTRGAVKKRARGTDNEDMASSGRVSPKVVKKHAKVVQHVDPDRAYCQSRSVLTSSAGARPLSPSRHNGAAVDEQELLFIPSQTDDPGNLGLDHMSAAELAAMLEDDAGEVIDLNEPTMEWEESVDGNDVAAFHSPGPQEDDSELGATQAHGSGSKVRLSRITKSLMRLPTVLAEISPAFRRLGTLTESSVGSFYDLIMIIYLTLSERD